MKRQLLTLLAAAVLAVTLAGVAAAQNGTGQHPQLGQYHDPANAVEDGYLPTDVCIPGMGYHYMKPSLLDGTVNPAQPEILVYEETGDRRQLVAAEYMSTEQDRLFGQEMHPFHGMYTLHAWFWKHNPDGIFTAFNPTVSCPAEDVPPGGH